MTVAEQGLTQTQDQRLQMILAPQLRQSLELLQVPVLELRSLIQQELQKNPTLEEKLPDNVQIEVEPGTPEPEDNKALDFKEEFEVLARLDDEWKEYFHQNQTFRRSSPDEDAKRQFLLDSISQPESLQDHLLNQMNLSGLDAQEQQIGELLIGSINDDGYLTTSVDDLTQTTGFDRQRLEDILSLIQEFDPIGVGAGNLKECLVLQLRRLGKGDSPAVPLVQEHLEELGAKKYPLIAKAMKLSLEEVHRLARLVSTLEPKPGRMFNSDAPAYVLPEVSVRKVGDEYVIMMSRDQVPHLRISKHYRQLMEDASTTEEVKTYIREKVRAGAFLIKSIHQRQETIHRIATEIVKVQKDFFEQGISQLRPLTMSEIADKLGIHETTVSRALSNKFMQTPRGMFEMKYFFTPGFKTADGQDISNKTIKDTLLQMVQKESPSDPMSDQAMVEQLQEMGIKVARRTIAKYRDALHILPSHLRKS
ncbi:MAG: RNA polymerase factor sigma-54 [Lentisphaerota bacterium]